MTTPRRKWLLFLLVGISLAALILRPASSEVYSDFTYGPDWEQSCSPRGCTLTLYPYQKYFQESGAWKQVNENFQPCLEGFCTQPNLYKATVSNGQATLTSGLGTLSFRPLTLGGAPFTFTPSVNGDQIAYHDILPGIDLEYTYLPRSFKEEIILKYPLFTAYTQDPLLTYSLTPTGFFLQDPIACDQADECIPLNFTLKGGIYSLTLPLEWLNNESRLYPITIDPTVLLDNQSVIFQGYVTRNPSVIPNTYQRQSTTDLKAGYFLGGFPTSRKVFRSLLEWNTSAVPDNAKITNITLSLKATQIANCPANTNITFQDLDQQAAAYPNNASGNAILYNDTANSTLGKQPFNWTNITSTGFYNLTLQASWDLEQKLKDDWFSVGIAAQAEGQCNSPTSNATNETRFDSPTATSPSFRPVLTISYFIPANESEGRTAIETGIKNSLGQSQPIQTDQYIYLVNQNSQHFLGSFDKAASQGNQTWAFNYVTGNESFTSMPSLFQILNVWENQTLPPETITSQVEAFINATKE